MLSCLLGLTACGGTGRDGDGVSGRGERGNRDDELVVLLPSAPEQLDPRYLVDAYGLKVSRLIFASLVTIDPATLAAVPDLAESIVNQTPTRYRVRLRDGLRFSDGTPLDAVDVIATFRSILDPEMRSPRAGMFRRIVAMEAPDRLTIDFEIDAPHATFLTDLEMPILRSEDATRRLPTVEPTAFVGAGPYRLEEWQGGTLTLVASPYWHGGQPHRPRLRFTVIRDDNTRALRLLAGEGDLALNAVPPILLPLFADPARFTTRSVAGSGTTYVGMNLERPMLADVRVRRAFAHAVDREALIRAKLEGRASAARTFVPPGHWAHSDDAVSDYVFDPVRARRLLDAAGFPDLDGSGPAWRFRLILRTSSDRNRLSISRAIAAMLADVGVEVVVRPSEKAALVEDLNRGRFDLALFQVSEMIEPHFLSLFFSSTQVPAAGGFNRWHYANAELDAALEWGRRDSEPRSRRAAYANVQRLLARDLPVLPLWHEDVVMVCRGECGDLQVPRDARFSTLAR